MNLKPISYLSRCPDCSVEMQVELLESLAAEMDRLPDNPNVLKIRCDPCMDKAVISRKEGVLREAKVTFDDARRVAWEAVCPENFRSISEGGETDESSLAGGAYIIPEVGPISYRELLAIAAAPGIGSPIIFVAGAPGTRKTRLAWRMARAAFDAPVMVPARPWGVFFTSWQFQTAAQDAAGKFTAGDWMARLVASRIVVFDDIGKTAWTDNTAAAFFELLDQRAACNRLTVITSNFAGRDFKAWLQDSKSSVLATSSEPILRRIRERGRLIVCQ